MKKPAETGVVHTLTIENYSSDGQGVAHLPGGMAIFVAGGLAGEVCRVRLTKVGRSAAWGSLVEVVSPSPHRIAPDCPYAGQCGGCQTRHMAYAEELAFKKQRVEDALRRIGGVDLPVSAIHGAAETTRYRNKAQFPVAAGPAIGFYRPRSHQVVDVDDCLLQPAAAARLRTAFRAWMGAHSIPAYDERTRKGVVRHLYVRTNGAGESLCCVVANRATLPRETELVAALREAEPGLVGVMLSENRRDTNVILGDRYRTLWGRDCLDDTLCNKVFRLSVPSFYQVNRAQTQVLYRLAAEFAALDRAQTALDLYCGIGSITLVLAETAGKVIGAEIVPEAVEDARANALQNGTHNVEFHCADAAEMAAALARRGLSPDVVCVDPPRKGLDPQVIEAVAAMAPKRVVYVSCDPGTLARDVARFGAAGYVAVRAEAVDLFPRTSHVETVLLMTSQR